MHKKRVIVGLSGGVDSSITAHLLKQQGHDITGVYMKNWDDDSEQCNNDRDENDAKKICEGLGIEFETVNFSQDYMDKVFAHMLCDLKKGHTPNPDILCNQEIKFKVLLDYAMSKQADYLATGHYANIETRFGKSALIMAADQNKDQTYFLSRIPREALDKVWFPIGRYPKAEIRRLAKKWALDNALKKDSTGICFIGERKFSDFIGEYLLNKPGLITDEHGKKIGTHHGLFFYTIGQRKGLGIGGRKDADEEPWFVVQKCMANNTLICAQGNHHPALYQRALRAQDIHWLIDSGHIDGPFAAQVRIRHRQPLQEAKITIQDDTMVVEFQAPQRAITPGQSVVAYINDCCVASAIITEAIHKHD